MTRSHVFLITVLLAFDFQAAAQTGAVRVGPIYVEKFPDLEIVIESTSAVAAETLTLIEDGRATVNATGVRPFKETGRGMAIVLALDVSGTMAGQPLADMKRALWAFVAQAGRQDRVAIVSFADTIKVEAPFGSSPEELKAAIDRLAIRGRITELYRGLRQSLAVFDAANLPERKRLIVVSDGYDEGVAYKLEDVIEEAKRRDIPVDAVGLTRIDPKHLSNLNRLADKSGGRYERAEDSSQLENVYRRGVERLQATPVALFTARNLQADGQERRVGVRVNDGGRTTTAEITLIMTKREAPTALSQSQSGDASRGLAGKIPIWAWPVGALAALGSIALVATRLRKRRAVRRDGSIAPINQPAGDSSSAYSSSSGEATKAEMEAEAPDEPWPASLIAESEAAGDRIREASPAPSSTRRKTQARVEFRAPEIGRPCAILIAEEGAKVGVRAPVECNPFWIGSEDDCALFISEDTYLSGYHACIEYREGTLLLYDNNSTNGTYLNGERLAGAPRPLGIGDRIKVGHSIFVVDCA